MSWRNHSQASTCAHAQTWLLHAEQHVPYGAGPAHNTSALRPEPVPVIPEARGLQRCTTKGKSTHQNCTACNHLFLSNSLCQACMSVSVLSNRCCQCMSAEMTGFVWMHIETTTVLSDAAHPSTSAGAPTCVCSCSQGRACSCDFVTYWLKPVCAMRRCRCRTLSWRRFACLCWR